MPHLTRTAVAATAVVLLIALSATFAQTGKPVPWKGFQSADIAERVKLTTESDGTLQWGPRKIPPPALASPELQKAYVQRWKQALEGRSAAGGDPEAFRRRIIEEGVRRRAEILKVHPVNVEEKELGGVKVAIYTAKDITPRNRNRVVMEFESDDEGIMLASLGKMKTMSVHFIVRRPGNPEPDIRYITEQVVAVYRELLKTHKPAQIAMMGLSGGCQLAANTSVWLSQQKLPFPAAVGLVTCAGGGRPGDTRITLDGLDPALSSIGRPGGPTVREPAKPGEPGREILDAEIPKGYPPSYLLTGTRDMSLSHMVLLHRKLRRAGAVADLNVFEGLWHGGSAVAIPEAEEALNDFARFLDRHMGV